MVQTSIAQKERCLGGIPKQRLLCRDPPSWHKRLSILPRIPISLTLFGSRKTGTE